MPTQNSKVKHVILADDDEDDQSLFLEVVKEISCSIRLSFAKDGKELLAFLENNTPDLIFLDLNMPLKDGLECIREIRSTETKNSLPIIIYSTSSSQQSIDECYKEGANYYIVKPYTVEKISMALSEVLVKDWNHPYPLSREQFLIKF
jgi:CheY-like chemotaxis protein